MCGTGSYLYFHGLNYGRQEQDCRRMFELPESSAALFDSYGVDYVFISGYERYNFTADEEYFRENCPLVFSQADVQIYAWSERARADAEKRSFIRTIGGF